MADPTRAARSRARGAARPAILGVIAALALGGCSRCGGGGGKGGGSRESSPSAPPRVLLSPVPLGPAPPLPFPSGAALAGALTPEPIASRIPALQGNYYLFNTEEILESPLHGAVLHDHDGMRRFVMHDATSAAPVGGAWILVSANTGLWLHEADTLARRARLVAPPVGAMAASPNGKLFAFVTGSSPYTLRITSFPELTSVRTLANIDEPHRVRFSPDGARVVLASTAEETVTMVDVATGRVLRHDAGDDVNDAIAMADRASDVAFVTDSDDTFVYDMEARRQIFDSAPLYRAYGGQFAYMTRDQNTVAQDPATGDLFSGGDDNKVWRFTGYRTPSPASAPLEFDGNVEDILCCRGTSLVVGLDTLAVHIVKPDGTFEASLRPLNLGIDSDDVRLALMPDQSVLAVLDGRPCRYNPADGQSLVATDYAREEQWTASPGRDDTVLIACRSVPASQDAQTCMVRRAAHVAAVDVEAAQIGTVDLYGIPNLFDFHDQTRLIVGPGPGKRLRVAFIEPGGGLLPPMDTPALVPGAFQTRADKQIVAFLDATGKLFELGPTAPWIEEIGRGPAPELLAQIEWKPDTKRWRLVSRSGEVTEVTGRR